MRDGVVPPPVEHRALERLRVARRADLARALFQRAREICEPELVQRLLEQSDVLFLVDEPGGAHGGNVRERGLGGIGGCFASRRAFRRPGSSGSFRSLWAPPATFEIWRRTHGSTEHRGGRHRDVFLCRPVPSAGRHSVLRRGGTCGSLATRVRRVRGACLTGRPRFLGSGETPFLRNIQREKRTGPRAVEAAPGSPEFLDRRGRSPPISLRSAQGSAPSTRSARNGEAP